MLPPASSENVIYLALELRSSTWLVTARLPGEGGQYETTAEIVRVIALTGCRRSEVIRLRFGEVDIEGSCLRLTDGKEGASVRPIGLPVLNTLRVAATRNRVLTTMSSPGGRMTLRSGLSRDNGQSSSRIPTWLGLRHMYYGTASQVSATILGSPRPRSPLWLDTREER